MRCFLIAPKIKPFQRLFKILDNQGIRPRYRGPAGDQDIIVIGRRVNGQDGARRRPQTPAGAVSLHRSANPAAGRQSETDRVTRMRMAAGLQHESRCHGFFSLCCNPKKFRPPLEGADGRRHSALRRQAFTTFFPAPGQYVAPGLRRHPGAEPVAPLAHKTARLVGTFHVASPRPWKEWPLYRSSPRPSQSEQVAGPSEKLQRRRFTRR